MEHIDLIVFLGTFMFSFVGAHYFEARKGEAQCCHVCAGTPEVRRHTEGYEI